MHQKVSYTIQVEISNLDLVVIQNEKTNKLVPEMILKIIL